MSEEFADAVSRAESSAMNCDNCGRASRRGSAWMRHETDVVICGRSGCSDVRRRATRDYQEGHDVRL